MAAVVLVIAEFSTISYRTIGIGACADRVGADKCRTVGHDAHAFALVILAVVGLVMAWGAVVGRSLAAAWATVAVSVAVLVIAAALDGPSLGDKRGLEKLYDNVHPHTGDGFRLELIGGVLLLLVGGLAVQRLRATEEEAPLAAMPPPEGEAVEEVEAAEPVEPLADEAEPAPYRPRPRTTARAKARERSRQRQRRKPGSS